MIHLSDLNIQPVIEFFRVHPHSAGIITYFIIFLEAMAVIGMLVPGAIIMPAIGFLIGANIIPAGSTFLCAIAGALTGDYLSYFIGVYYKDRIHRIWPFTKWPHLLESGEKYFRAHGGKSILIGRFLGPTRAMIPMVAGMMNMSFMRFVFVSIPSATVWAIGYMIPGILLGALSLELPPKIATEFTLWMLLIIIGLWVIVYFIKNFFKKIWQIIDFCIKQIWQWLGKHRISQWITKILIDPTKPQDHQQLTLILLAMLTFALFLYMLSFGLTYGLLTYLNKPLYYLLSSLRTQVVDQIAVFITLLGDSIQLIIASMIFLLWLLWKRYWYVAAHWFGVMVLSLGLAGAVKLLMYVPRPGDVLYGRDVSSFPSAHTALVLALYGFLAVIIARASKKNNRRIPYTIAWILVGLVACSRLYLGAHWLSDILGSVFLGLSVVLVVAISYRRRVFAYFSARKIILVILSIFMGTWFIYSMIKFPSEVEQYRLMWPQQTVDLNTLNKFDSDVMPIYRNNRLGYPMEVFNIEWVGDIELIKNGLLEKGWALQSGGMDLSNIAKGFFDTSAVYHLPVFPQLYHNKSPVLVLTKDTKNDNTILILRLWASDFSLRDSKLPLWIGSVSYYHHPEAEVISLDDFKKRALFIGATDVFIKQLNDFDYRQIIYPQEQLPPEVIQMNWDGKVLIIKPIKKLSF